MAKTYSLNYLANEFAIDRQTAVRATRDLKPTEEKTKGRPTFSIAAFARALESHRAVNASNNDFSLDAGDTSPLLEARIRITIANAIARERENAVEAGKLVSIADMIEGYTASLAVFHQILTAGVRIANDLMPHTPLDQAAIVEQGEPRKIFDMIDELRKPLTSMTARIVARAVAALPKELSIAPREETA